MSFARRTRAVLVTGLVASLVWAVFAAAAGAAVLLVTGQWSNDLLASALIKGYAVSGAVLGALCGGLFAVVLSIAEQSASVARLSTWRAGMWGALAGTLFPAVLMLTRLLALSTQPFGTDLLIFLAVNAAIGASTAAGAVAIAKRGSASAAELEGYDAPALLPRDPAAAR